MIDISTYLNRITSEHKNKPKFMELVKARLEPFIDLCELLEDIDKSFDLDTASGAQLDIIGQYVGVSRLLDFQPNSADSLLPDAYYRMLLKARISLNNWDGSIEGYITPKPMGVLIDYSVVFSIKLDTRLFIGNAVYNRLLEKTLPAPAPPTNNSKPPGAFYVTGMATAISATMQTQGKPPSDRISVEKIGLFLGATKPESSAIATLQTKPPPSGITVETETMFAGGLLIARTIQSSINSQVQ